MVKVITFEGSDYSGKTATLNHLSKEFEGRKGYCFNEGAVYPTGLSARLSSISNQCDSAEKEFLYTMGYVLDNIQSVRNHPQDERVFFQDRYWSSAVAYGRFLNGDNSIHNHQDFKSLFLIPTSTILFSCSYQEKINRSNIRGRKSIIDKFLLNESSRLVQLENEIERSLEGLPNIYRIDTTGMPIEDVASKIKSYLTDNKII